MSASISPLFALSSQGGGSTPVLQTKNVKLSSNGTVSITPDAGYDGLEQVNVTVSTRFKPVGGMIFYIDSSSTKTYKFYDSGYNEIQSVAVGDSPMFYEELTEGNGKEKYYVYYNSCYTSKGWTYRSGGQAVLELLNTSQAIGEGKNNTSIVMAKDNGAYIASYSSGGTTKDTAWKLIQTLREASTAGCNDWYIGSRYENDTLNQFMVDNVGTVSNLFSGVSVWSSSEVIEWPEYVYVRDNGEYNTQKKSTNLCVIPIRSF